MTVSEADTELAKAIGVEMGNDEGSFTLKEEEELCVGQRVIDDLGKDRLSELGVTAEDASAIDTAEFTEEEDDLMISSLFDCIDGREFMNQSFTASGLPEETIKCINERVSDEAIDDFFESMMSNGTPNQEFADAREECVTNS